MGRLQDTLRLNHQLFLKKEVAMTAVVSEPKITIADV